jgi:transcription initiation factor TFIIIB Brf1 subunit/transcription initiation factor TFIIB
LLSGRGAAAAPQVLKFEVDLEQPHKYLLNYCRTLQLRQQQVRPAVSLMSDVLTMTDLCEGEGPAELAAGVLHVALALLDARVAGVQEVAHVWPLLGVQQGRALAVAERVAALL